MQSLIRYARVDDAPAIADIMHAVWSHDNPDMVLVASVIRLSQHVTLVATLDERIVGFIDGFMTQSSEGEPRWELDLVAVKPEYQQKGIAQQLIQTFTYAGQERGANFTRALVHIDNTPCQFALAKCGYECDGAVYSLYVASGGIAVEAQMSPTAHLIPVQTFAYYGIWLEDVRSPQDLANARTLRLQTRLDIVGAAIPQTDQALTAAAQAAGFENNGSYQYWRRGN